MTRDELEREIRLLRRWAEAALEVIERGVVICDDAGRLGEWTGVRFVRESYDNLGLYDTPEYDAYEARP